MEVEHTRVDIAKCLAAGDSPAIIIPRKGSETWYVPDGTLDPGSPIPWTYFQQHDSVLIPLVPYLLRGEPELAMAYVLSLGLHCGFNLNRRIRKVHIGIGTPVEVMPDTSLRYYVGFGLLLE